MKIEQSAFRRCSSLTNIEFKGDVMKFADFAFQDCTGLTNIVIPSSVSDLRASAFIGCTGVETIRFNGLVVCDMYWLIKYIMIADEGGDRFGFGARVRHGRLEKILVPKGWGNFYTKLIKGPSVLEGDEERYIELIEEV